MFILLSFNYSNNEMQFPNAILFLFVLTPSISTFDKILKFNKLFKKCVDFIKAIIII